MFGLRSARLSFRRSESKITIELFPMVHVGERRFYDETFSEASKCDVILFEGIKSSIGRNLTRSYRWMSLAKLGLVLQPRLTQEHVPGSRLVHADLQPDEFQREWKKAKLYVRTAFFVLAPLYGIWQRLFASRESLAKRGALDDLPSSDEVLQWSPDFEAYGRSIGDARDERLISILEEEIASSGPEGQRIGIIYGARHLRAIIRHLSQNGFRSGKARWVVVIGL